MALHRHHKHSIFIVLTGIITAVLLFKFVGTTDLLKIFFSANKRLIIAAIFLQLPMLFFWNLKWKLVFNFMKQKISFWKLFIVLLIGNFGDTISPGSRIGGEPLRIYYLAKLGYKSDISLTTILLERLYNLVSFLFLALISFAYAFLKLKLPLWLSIVMSCAFIFVLSITYLLLYAFYHERKGIHFIMRVAAKILPIVYKMKHTHMHHKYKTYNDLYAHFYRVVKHFFSEVLVVSKNKKLWMEGIFISFLYWFIFYLQAWLLFKAVGVQIPFYFIIVMMTLSDLVGLALFVPSGAGVVEILMIAFATAIGIQLNVAVAATLLIRGNYYIFGLVAGYASMLYFAEEDRHTFVK